MAMAFLGSLEASLERRCAYSRAVIPGVTADTVAISDAFAKSVCQISHSPGLRRWGWVSCTGWPNESLAADTEAYERHWKGGSLLFTARLAMHGAIRKVNGLAHLFRTRPHDCMLDCSHLRP